MNLRYHIIEDGQIRAVGLADWAAWFECAERRVAWTEIGGVGVSTVFLSLDHGWRKDRVPVLFETMIFGDTLPELGDNDNIWRYCTIAEAQRGHTIICEKVREFRPDAKVQTEKFNLGEIADKVKYSDMVIRMKEAEKRWNLTDDEQG